MARNKHSKLTTGVSQDVKELRQKSKELLRRANKNVREYRHELALLKKQQVVSKRVDVRSQRPTRYMLSKIKKFSDVIEGKVNAVKAPKAIRKQYTDKGLFEERGSFLIVPKEYANQRAKIKRGMVAKYRPLTNGEERVLVLPYKATDLEHLAHLIHENHEAINMMKEPTEQFGFQLYGHNSKIGFPNANTPEGLSSYILSHYQHMFNRKDSLRHIVFLKYKHWGPPSSPPISGEKIYHYKKGDDRDPRHRWAMDKRRERAALRKARQRKAETDEQRQKRLDDQRKRSARNRQRKWEEQ